MRTVASRLLLLVQQNRGMRMPPPHGYDRRGVRTGGASSRLPRRDDNRFAVSHMPPSALMLNGYEKTSSARDDLPPSPLVIPYPKDIVAYLDQFVVGQELAKQTLAVGVYQHYKRVEFNIKAEKKQQIRRLLEDAYGRGQKREEGRRDVEKEDGFRLSQDPTDDLFMDKSNIVLLGPSGSGKTYLTTRLAKALNVPIALCDCTSLTQAGYVGDDVESVIQKLLVSADGDVEAVQRGIVFLDEFDKIYTSSDPTHTAGSRDVNGRGVQQALLKLVEGTKCLVKNPLVSNQKVEIDTTNVLFIASGAFAGLDKLVARRLDKRSLGFATTGAASSSRHLAEALESKSEEEAADARRHLLSEMDQNDLISFGMVPELVGRFPVLVPFEQLDERRLLEVLTGPRNSLISQARALFAEDGIELELTDCALKEMARQSVGRKTGARALRSILERVLLPAKYECPGSEAAAATTTVVISGAVVRGEKPYEKRTPLRRAAPDAATTDSRTKK